MENDEIMKMIWQFKYNGKIITNIHIYAGNLADAIIKQSMKKMSADNVTAIFISFHNFENKMKDLDFEYKNNVQCKLIEDEIDISEGKIK